MAASATLVHWVSAYAFCLLAIGAIVGSDLLLTPSLISLQTEIPIQTSVRLRPLYHSVEKATAEYREALDRIREDPNGLQEAHMRFMKAKQELDHGKQEAETAETAKGGEDDFDEEGAESMTFLAFEPFFSARPFLFCVITHGSMVLLLPLYHLLGLARKCVRLPRLRTLRRRMKESKNKPCMILAHINEQFDDCMIEGRLGSPGTPVAVVCLGACMMLWVVYQAIWRLSLEYASAPLATALQYLYVLCIPPLMVPVLQEKLNGLKLIAAAFCFIGIYTFFFPTVSSEPSGHNLSETVRATALSVFSALAFAFYLLLYRLLNPDGWMLRVLGFQGLATLLFGVPIVVVLHLAKLETFGLPASRSDWLILVYHCIFRAAVLYCINQALRWGEPLSVATCLTVVEPLAYLLRYFSGAEGTLMTSGKCVAVAMTAAGFLIVAVFHFGRAISGFTMLSLEGAAFRVGAQPEDSRRLIVGSEYVM